LLDILNGSLSSPSSPKKDGFQMIDVKEYLYQTKVPLQRKLQISPNRHDRFNQIPIFDDEKVERRKKYSQKILSKVSDTGVMVKATIIKTSIDHKETFTQVQSRRPSVEFDRLSRYLNTVPLNTNLAQSSVVIQKEKEESALLKHKRALSFKTLAKEKARINNISENNSNIPVENVHRGVVGSMQVKDENALINKPMTLRFVRNKVGGNKSHHQNPAPSAPLLHHSLPAQQSSPPQTRSPANTLLCTLYGIIPWTSSQVPRYNVGLGNNQQLIEKLLRLKGLTSENFYSKCNLLWTQTVSKRTNMLGSSANNVSAGHSGSLMVSSIATSYFGTENVDLFDGKTPEAYRAFKVKSAVDLEEEFKQCNIFRVSSITYPSNYLTQVCNHQATVTVVPRILENFTLLNHIKGLKYISKKHLLFSSLKEFCTQQAEVVSLLLQPQLIKQTTLEEEQPDTDAEPQEGSSRSANTFKFQKKKSTSELLRSLVPHTWVLYGNSFDEDLEKMIAEKEKNDPAWTSPLIVKPGENSNRGQGISIAFSAAEVKAVATSVLENRKNTSTVVVQEYITNPMLFHKRKFDIRCYGLVVRMPGKIFYFFYNRGYARTCSFEYSLDIKQNLMVHLTNEAVQVKDAKTFGKFEPGNKIYYDELDRYFNEQDEFISKQKLFKRDIVPRFKELAGIAFRSCSTKTAKDSSAEIGFELLGFDFMIDKELNVKLIEVNQNPCLSTLSEGQGVLINKLLSDVFRLTIDPIFCLQPSQKEDLAHSSGAYLERPAYLTDFELIFTQLG
jgi:hypothetical protein